MKVIPLSDSEQAATGYTHLLNYKVPGDTGATAILSVMPLAVGTVCHRAAIDFKTTLNVIAAPTVAVAVGATTVIAATAATGSTCIASNTISNVNAAGFVLVTVGGTGGPATAGEFNVFVHLQDLTKQRASLAP